LETIYSRLREVACRQPGKNAVVVDDRVYTFQQLLADIDANAARLNSEGIQPSDCVGVLFGNSYEFIVAAFAVFASGAKLVPLNPKFAAEELEYYLDNASVKWLFYPAGHETSLAYLESRLVQGSSEVLGLPPAAATPKQDFDIAASGLYMFSSGSTGKSKRVTRSQANLLAEYDAIAKMVNLQGDDVFLCTIPLYHTHGFGNALFGALFSGSTLVLLTAEFNGRKTVEAIEQFSVTVYPSVPFMLQIMAMTRFKESPAVATLRLVISAGAPLSEKIYQEFKAKFGIGISQLYGSTETGAVCVNLHPEQHGFASCGLPLPGNIVEIRNDEGKALATGEEGEIWVSSPAMTQAYDDLPEITRECCIDNFFFLGDLGTYTDSGVTIKGRKKLLVNVAGNKVDPLEVEEVLNLHSNVIESVVVGKPHDITGEQLKAYIVAKDGEIDGHEYASFLKQHLVEYKIPKEFQTIDEIPKSPLGKILRKYL